MFVSEKQEAKKIINRLPQNTSFEDIQYHIYIAEKLRNARQDIENNLTHTQKEVEKKLDKWIIK